MTPQATNSAKQQKEPGTTSKILRWQYGKNYGSNSALNSADAPSLRGAAADGRDAKRLGIARPRRSDRRGHPIHRGLATVGRSMPPFHCLRTVGQS